MQNFNLLIGGIILVVTIFAIFAFPKIIKYAIFLLILYLTIFISIFFIALFIPLLILIIYFKWRKK